MAQANQFAQPINYYGTPGQTSWAGYIFKELLGYTSGRHTGDDYNGAGGGNSDLGMEIRSIANGIVRWTGNRNNLGFGNVTIIEYPLSPTLAAELGCSSLFGRYMHQNTIEVGVGQEVSIGQRIGSVGNSGTQYAHLHLDLYKNTIDGGGIHLRYDKDTQLSSYLSPYNYIQSHLNAVDVAGPAPSLKPFQREVGNASGVNERAAPSTSARITREFAQNEVLDMKGYIEGEFVNGSNLWFVGAYAGLFFHTRSFKDSGVHDLANLTPAPVPPPTPNPTPPPVPEPDSRINDVINKKHQIVPRDYAPVDLVTLPGGQSLRSQAAAAYTRMANDAAIAGNPINASSGYRSLDAQATLYNRYVATDGAEQADTYSARPGHSEHQTGLSIDIGGGGFNIEDGFKNTAQSKWLVGNAHGYGFVLRYPEGKQAITGYIYEPWHYRYVGVTDALDIVAEKKTLEEFYDVTGGDYETPPAPTPPPIPSPGPTDLDKENNNLLKQILLLLTDLINRFKGVFK